MRILSQHNQILTSIHYDICATLLFNSVLQGISLSKATPSKNSKKPRFHIDSERLLYCQISGTHSWSFKLQSSISKFIFSSYLPWHQLQNEEQVDSKTKTRLRLYHRHCKDFKGSYASLTGPKGRLDIVSERRPCCPTACSMV